MEKDELQKLRILLIVAVMLVIAGYIINIFVGKEYPLLANIIKYLLFGSGLITFAIGIIMLIAKTKKKNINLEQEYEQKKKEHELRLKIMQMETEQKREEAKQKEIENNLRIQESKIQRLQPTQQKRDLLDSMSDFVKPQQQQQDTYERISDMARIEKPRQQQQMKRKQPNNTYIIVPQNVQHIGKTFKQPLQMKRQDNINDFSQFNDFAIKKPKNKKDDYFR